MENDQPFRVKLVGQDVNPGKLLAIGLLSLAPVVVAILMQNPALRQALQLRAWHIARQAAKKGEAWCDKMGAIANHRYDLARL